MLLTAMVIIVILIVFAALIYIVPYLRYQTAKLTEGTDTSHIVSVGHRGAAAHAPENTLAGFRKAMEIGVDFIELDVHLTQDHQVVVIHDANTKRTTGVDAAVADLTLSEIKKMDAGTWFDEEFANERVPTLSEALQLINGRCQVMIEIKWPKKGIYEQIVEEIVKIIDQHAAASWVVIQSFEPAYLREIYEIRPSLTIHQLLIGDAVLLPVYQGRSFHFGSFSPVAGVKSVNVYCIYLNESMKKQYGVYELGVFTVNTEEAITRSIANGATYIISDRPELVKKFKDTD